MLFANKTARALLSISAFTILSIASPNTLDAATFSIPAQYKPYVLYKHTTYKAIEVKYCLKIRKAKKRTEVLSLAKKGVNEIFSSLYDSLPKKTVDQVKETVFSEIQDCFTSLNRINDKDKFKEAINEAFAEVQSDDVASYKKLTWYAYKSAKSVIDTALDVL
ncbi:MAG: hypothetical protein SNF33_00770 [Candidatus Algichlamydia australiensis]|nr:hypothetical protein [Chlamydiales bacterium]